MERKLILDYDSGRIAAKLDRGEKTLVQNVRLRLRAAERLALIGETGSGKTMTALSVMRLLPDNVKMTDGKLLFDGRELLKEKSIRPLLGLEIVYIPQNGLEFLNPSRSVRLQLHDNLKKLDVPRSRLREKAQEALHAAGFDEPEEILEKYPFQLSGGMAQRVTIALAACSRAKLLIADEPTNGLDPEATARFFGLLDRVFPDAAKLIITHDIAVASLCDRIQVLCGGRTAECGPALQVLGTPRHPYTKTLLAALVENGMKESPPLCAQEGPCPFYRRCVYASEACLADPPRRADADTEWWCCQP